MSDIYQEAKRKARYGHRDWIWWVDKDGVHHADVKSAEVIKKALDAVGEDGHFGSLEASTGQGYRVNPEMTRTMIRNAQYGI
jgi:hypothetical protein